MAILCTYTYDPLDRVSTLTPLAQAVSSRFYNGGQLMTELQGDRQRTWVRAGGQLLAQQNREGEEVVTTMIACDLHNSVLHASEDGRQADIVYTPFGHRQAEQTVSALPGFNGEQPDPVTGHYLLGNGYRAYNPMLMRFNSPDSLSPFGKGGLNAYAYCVGDPVNRFDPTGHFSALASLLAGIALSSVGAGAIIATAAALDDPNSTLGTALTVAGSISLMAGLGAFGATGFKSKQMRAKIKKVKNKKNSLKNQLAESRTARKQSSAGHKEQIVALNQQLGEYKSMAGDDRAMRKLYHELSGSDVLRVHGKHYYSDSRLSPEKAQLLREDWSRTRIFGLLEGGDNGTLSISRVREGEVLDHTSFTIKEVRS